MNQKLPQIKKCFGNRYVFLKVCLLFEILRWFVCIFKTNQDHQTIPMIRENEILVMILLIKYWRLFLQYIFFLHQIMISMFCSCRGFSSFSEGKQKLRTFCHGGQCLTNHVNQFLSFPSHTMSSFV